MAIVDVLQIFKDGGYENVGIMTDTHNNYHCNVRALHCLSPYMTNSLRQYAVLSHTKLIVTVKLPILPITIQKEMI